MKKSLTLIGILVATLFFTTPVISMEGHGKNIHESKVNGTTLTYQLIDMTENIKKMNDKNAAHQMTGTHHLMIMPKGGDDLSGAKVGFAVTDPDGKTHKAMAMGMGGGFGADLPMMKNGKYTIKTKILKNKTRLDDEFIYHKH